IHTLDMRSGETGQTLTAQHVVSANGPLSTPRMPEVAGMASFNGPAFHTAQWDYSVDLKGKRVGIVGTGASAAQVITSIADDVETLTVFQRSATWALPRDDEPTPPEKVSAFKKGGYNESQRFVDLQKVFVNYNETEKAKAGFEKKQTELRKELEKKQKKVEQAQKDNK
ncbi:MAG: SidA/IucD/PvdA family monooxygenase, partial [Gammaproteobacteria bacterium]